MRGHCSISIIHMYSLVLRHSWCCCFGPWVQFLRAVFPHSSTTSTGRRLLPLTAPRPHLRPSQAAAQRSSSFSSSIKTISKPSLKRISASLRHFPAIWSCRHSRLPSAAVPLLFLVCFSLNLDLDRETEGLWEQRGIR